NEKLKAVTALQPGQRYDEGIVKADMKQLENYYGYRGISAHVERRPVVDVKYLVQGDRGMQDRVGRIIIDGNSVTRDRVIMNQLGLYPGQILQYPELENARIRLSRLGIFDQANPPE